MRGVVISATIVAIGIVFGGIAFALIGAVLNVEDGGALVRLNRAQVELKALQADLDTTRSELRAARAEVDALGAALSRAETQTAAQAPTSVLLSGTGGVDFIHDHDETVEMTEEMLLAKDRFNIGITQPGNRVMLEILGQPRQQYGTDCQSVTNPRLRDLMETRQMGPIRVTMIRPALDSLERILQRLEEREPDIHAALGTAGALCVRLVRGSRSSVSNHSWGTAIDVKLEGRLDGFGDGATQFGLLLIAELFNEEGWFWGATYSREDSMHFEVGVETLRAWEAEGQL